MGYDDDDTVFESVEEKKEEVNLDEVYDDVE